MTDNANKDQGKDVPDWWKNPDYNGPGEYASGVVSAALNTALVAFQRGHIGIDDLPKATDAVIRLFDSAESLTKKEERFVRFPSWIVEDGD